MKMRFYGVVCVFLLVVIAFTGCGGGGGGGGTGENSADQILASQLVGTWKLSQATKEGVLVPVVPTDAGEIGIMSFGADRTATGNDFTITTSTAATPLDPSAPPAPPSPDFFKTTVVTASNAVHSWAVSGDSLIVTSADGKTRTSKIEIKNDNLYQISPDGDIMVWSRA